MKSRAEILKVHCEKKPLDKDVDLMEIARKTSGLSGADLANIANEAAIFAARADKKKISRNDFHEAVEKIALGPERKSHILSNKEREITAYHEAGHALVSHLLPNCHPVHKVSIISRGMAGGVTWSLPEEDKHLHSVAEFKDEMAMALGGRVAEKLIFKDITTGAESDLKHANSLARKMITEYGMGSKLTNQVFGDNEGSVFLGRTMAEGRSYSEEVASEIDAEVSKLIEEAASRAEKTIRANKSKLVLIAKTLLKKETLEEAEFKKLISKN
jgi:cell division protease FtsH